MDRMTRVILAPCLGHQLGIEGFFLGGGVGFHVVIKTVPGVAALGAVAFGVGVLGPVMMRPWIGDLPDEMAGAMGTLTAASFLIGLVAVTLVERFISGPENNKGESSND